MLAVAALAVAALWESMPSLGWEEIVRDVQSAAAAQSISRAAGDSSSSIASLPGRIVTGLLYIVNSKFNTIGAHYKYYVRSLYI